MLIKSTSSISYSVASSPPGDTHRILVDAAYGHASGANIYVRNPTDTDSAPTIITSPPLSTFRVASGITSASSAILYTDSSGIICARSSGSSTTFRLSPVGFWLKR